MEITLTVNVVGAAHRFGVLVDALKDLSPVLKEFDRYKRGKIDELFSTEGGGKWPARSERSEERGWKRTIERAERAPQTLLRKIQREHHRASSNLRKFERRGQRSDKEGASRINTVARRAFVLAEFERQVESGRLNVAGFENADKRPTKSVRGLGARLDRARARAQKAGRLLGSLPQTFRSTIKSGQLVIDSAWDSPAVRALNDGATVGHGAKLEPRPFFFWDDADVEYLAILFKERAMLAWRS